MCCHNLLLFVLRSILLLLQLQAAQLMTTLWSQQRRSTVATTISNVSHPRMLKAQQSMSRKWQQVAAMAAAGGCGQDATI